MDFFALDGHAAVDQIDNQIARANFGVTGEGTAPRREGVALLMRRALSVSMPRKSFTRSGWPSNLAASSCIRAAGDAFSIQMWAEHIAGGMMGALVTNKVHRLGDAMQAGLLDLWQYAGNASDELLFYEVFGDPALVVNP